MVKVHRSIEKYDPTGGAKLTTWIWRIAHNIGVDYSRKQVQLSSQTSSHCPLVETSEKGFERRLANDWFRDQRATELRQAASDGTKDPESVQRLRKALSEISEDDRQLIIMRLSMEYDEIARAEGVTEGAVRTRYSRAVARLRASYEEVSL